MPGPITLPTQVVRPDDHYNPPTISASFSRTRLPELSYQRVGLIAIEIRDTLLKTHTASLKSLTGGINKEIAATAFIVSGSALDVANGQLGALHSLITQKQSKLKAAKQIVKRHFEYDPTTASNQRLFTDFTQRSKTIHPPAAVQAFAEGLSAAYEAEAWSQAITQLQRKAESVAQTVSMLQAQAAERMAAEQAEAARIAAEVQLTRLANTYSTSTEVVVAGSAIISATGHAASTFTDFFAQGVIGAAVRALGSFTASVAAGFTVGVSALLYSPRLGNGELPQRYALITPLSDLAPQLSSALATANATSSEVELPYRLGDGINASGDSDLFVVKTDGHSVLSQVRVIPAVYDAQHNVYSATTADIPARILTWTPAVQPGDPSTTLPVEHLEPPVYQGVALTPIEVWIDSYPGAPDASPDDYVIVFPANSGLPPLYVMFRDRRAQAGTVTGIGKAEGSVWLELASEGNGVAIPTRIANELRGRQFKSWRSFRRAFWKAVSTDTILTEHFNSNSLSKIMKGYAPTVREADRVGARGVFELHHITPIAQDGELYNIDNLSITTPKLHIEIHKRK